MAVIAHLQGKTVHGGGDSFWTECSCGWQGDPRGFEEHLRQEIESLTTQLRGAVEALQAIAAARYGAPDATADARLRTVTGYAKEVLNRLGGQYDAAPSATPDDDVAQLDEGENYRRQRNQDRHGR